MKKPNLLLFIFYAWLVAGSLDILGAIFILGKGNAVGTLKYIATAVTGDISKMSETTAVSLGLLFHYGIAICWTILYFLIFKAVRFDKLHIIISALLYGFFIYFTMRYLLVPTLSHLKQPAPIDKTPVKDILKNALILVVAFGVPLKLFADSYFKRRSSY